MIAVHCLGGENLKGQIVFLHANGLHGRAYAPLASSLIAQGFRCLAPDLRVHGDSSIPTGTLSAGGGNLRWEKFAEDVGAVVNQLELHGCFVFGHSLGGAAALLQEQHAQGTFAGMYLFEPVAPVPAEVSPKLWESFLASRTFMGQTAKRRRPVFSSYDEAVQAYGSKPPFALVREDSLKAYVKFGFSETSAGSVEIKCRPDLEAEVFNQGAEHTAYDGLPLIACPVVIAAGKPRGVALFAEHLVNRLPNGTLEWVEHVEHFGPLEDPSFIAGRMLEFFNKCLKQKQEASSQSSISLRDEPSRASTTLRMRSNL
ncbi:hypothetical protein CYMTET_47800 [Cymbomonas tetramitiformis]|uniref:AB hydrolase-1 domain-containing protein n=1 Tax=Cymbomonas tetramitiformis TaxID=36881 RepID=A0AAE0EWC8_9CHLO|nr:hypothetical protein CYMTET_47800 [Cymbomonas tetramitiformis]